MPHPNAIRQLQTYGQPIVELDKLIEKMLSPKKKYNRQEQKFLHKKLINFSKTQYFNESLTKLVDDKYAYNRELSGYTLFYLWQAWKFTLPYETKADKENYYDNQRIYNGQLKWTFRLVHTLLNDSKIGPVEAALLAVRELSDINEENGKEFQDEVKKLCNHRSPVIRLRAVMVLPGTFPSNQEALNILSESALDTLVKSTYDGNEKVRDWACYELGQSVENINQKVERAFMDAYLREDEDSEVYVEAVAGLARCGNTEVVPIICEQLRREDVGWGWIDAAEMSQSSECLLALVDAYERILKDYPDDNILSDF